MIITYHGKQFFKLQQGDYTLAYNPLSKETKLDIKQTKFGANLCLVSLRHPNYNGTENTSFGDTVPFIIQGPGSYEVGGVTITGFGTKALVDDEPYVNTVYFVKHEDTSYCFIGDLEDPALDQHIKEFTESVDVLFVPIGSNGTLSPAQAAKLTKVFSPKAVIPMDYQEGRDEGSLDRFLKEMGSQTKAEERFVFKKSDLMSMSAQVVVLEQQ